MVKVPRLSLFLFSLSIIFALSSCSTLSKKQCLRGDWRVIGYSDGERGYPMSRLYDHNRACQEYNVLVNEKNYEEGWWKGIGKYCVPSNGFEKGEQLKDFNNVCPREMGRGFLNGYMEGLETALHNITWEYREEKEKYRIFSRRIMRADDKQQREKLEKKIKKLEKKLEALEGQIKKIQRLKSKTRVRQLSIISH
ncbi:MAG: DUF2799 domain-containing protein [Nitrospinae bacterium]|nr:DUF2799 domain-containing protein [Nitrospinota bacterium]